MYLIQEFLIDIPTGKFHPDGSGTIIKQSKQKGNTCDFYAMKFLMTQNRVKSGQSKDEIEKDFSANRKLRTCNDHCNELLNIFISDLSDLDTLETETLDLPAFLNRFKKGFKENTDCWQSDQPELYERYANVIQFLNKELENIDQNKLTSSLNSKNFSRIEWLTILKNYISYNIKIRQLKIFQKYINQDMIEENYTMSHYAQGYNSFTLDPFRGEKDFDCYYQQAVNTFFLFCAKRLGIKQSNWFPSENYMEIINQFLTNGPYMVFGHFGEYYHNEDPIKLDYLIDGREVFYWPSGSYKVEQEGKFKYTHAINIVMFQLVKNLDTQVEECFIYYTDPSRENDPNNKAPLFVIPFSTFIWRISNTYHWYGNKSDKPTRWQSENKTYNRFLFFSEKDVSKLSAIIKEYRTADITVFPNYNVIDKPSDYQRNESKSCIIN